jgi:hypothetical protein
MDTMKVADVVLAEGCSEKRKTVQLVALSRKTWSMHSSFRPRKKPTDTCAAPSLRR